MINVLSRPQRLLFPVASALVLILAVAATPRAAAACTAPATDYGTVTMSVTAPATTTYRIWSRMLVPDSTNNTYLLEVDGGQCYNVGGSNISANTWTWVAHKDGNFASKIDQSLAKGAHTFKLIGNKPGVEVDRVILTSDTSCTPTGDGSNCNITTDTTPPSVKLTAPASGSTVGGTVAVTASASDNVGVTKVDFYIDSSLQASDNTAPYTFQWDSSTVTNSQHTLIAKAYDGSGNVATDSYRITVRNGDKQAPTAPTKLTAKATAYNTVKLTWQASTDNAGIRAYTVFRDNLPVGQTTATAFQNTGLLPGTTYAYKVQATDTSSNISAFSNTASVTTPTVNDMQPPTTPKNLTAQAVSAGQINLSWSASTDNVGVKAYDVYRAAQGHKADQVAQVTGTTFGDGIVDAATTYSYTVRAVDANGNVSAFSMAINAATPVAKPLSALYGVVKDAHTKQPIGAGRALILADNNTYSSTLRSNGLYVFFDLNPGRYNLTFRADSYASQTITFKFSTGTQVHNVMLGKR